MQSIFTDPDLTEGERLERLTDLQNQMQDQFADPSEAPAGPKKPSVDTILQEAIESGPSDINTNQALDDDYDAIMKEIGVEDDSNLGNVQGEKGLTKEEAEKIQEEIDDAEEEMNSVNCIGGKK